LTKTLHGRGDPRHRRRRGDSLGRRCAGTAMMTAYSTLRPVVGSVAVGRESVQQRDHQRRTRLGRRIGSRWRGPKAALLRPKWATQLQPDARTVVGACSGTCLEETHSRSVDQTDGVRIRAVLTMARRSELMATWSVKSRAMTIKTDRRRRPRGREQSAATHVGALRVRRLRPCRAIDEDGRYRSMPLRSRGAG
jgi:hypothetical protein